MLLPGTLLLIDSEEEYFPEEILKLHSDVTTQGLSLIVCADWYDLDVINRVKFFDENTRDFWEAATGGANVPALNDLLQPYGIALGGKVLRGNIKGKGNQQTLFRSGNALVQFPTGGRVHYARLKDESKSFLGQGNNHIVEAAILGLYQSSNKGDKEERDTRSDSGSGSGGSGSGSGRVIVYGDSNCLDSSHIVFPCYWLLLDLVQYASTKVLGPNLQSMTHEVTDLDALGSATALNTFQPKRRKNPFLMEKASKVLQGKVGMDSHHQKCDAQKK